MNNVSTFDEETARAEIYGLLATLFYAAPSPELLAQLRMAVTQAPAAGAVLEEPWRELVSAARQLSDQAIRSEFNTLFGGVGKPEVYVFASHYLSGFLNEKPLAQLRQNLKALGLEREESMPETEDHFAYLCEVMRYLIAGEDVAVANLSRQKEFFGDHIQPWGNQFCDALEAHPASQFFRTLAQFTRAFLSVESQGFDMLV
jgi:TorA maturation chaperone TorD